MKNQNKNDITEEIIRDEYDFDYTKGVRGKYYRPATEENGYVKLTPEVNKVFKTSEDVNNALKAIMSAIPKTIKKVTKSTLI